MEKKGSNQVSDSVSMTPFPEKGKPDLGRISSAKALRDIVQKAVLDDTKSSMRRYGINNALDGKPPYTAESVQRSGNADRTNINLGEGDARMNQALTQYNDLLDNTPVLLDVQIPYGTMDDTEREYTQDVIASEVTVMIRDDEEFDKVIQLLAVEFLRHGVGFLYHSDDYGWMPDATGWGSCYIPRGTKASEKHIDVFLIEESLLPSQLYSRIRNEKLATEMGYNVEACRKALVRATVYGDKPLPADWTLQWDKVSAWLKNNDLWANQHDAARVRVVHSWSREYDGSISHHIIERDTLPTDKGADDFLFVKLGRFKKGQNPYTAFCLNIGVGQYHQIRGLGYKMFPFIQELNKMYCGMMDNVKLTGRTFLQETEEGGLDVDPITLSGPTAIISKKVNFVEHQWQDHSRTTLPVAADMRRMMENVAPSYQARGIGVDRQVRTAYELQAQQGLEAVLSTGAINMFYRSLRRAFKEMWRRIQEIVRKKMFDEYPEILDFVRRCEALGVSRDAILTVERVSEVRALGAGAPGQRQAISQRLLSRIQTFDEVGRARLLFDMDVADVGIRNAIRYRSRYMKPRPVVDQKIAELENGVMFGGGAVDPLEGENSAVHVAVHLGEGGQPAPNIATSMQLLEDWRNGGEQGSITDLQPHIAFLSLIIPHCERQVEAMSSDPTRAAQAGAYRKALKDFGAMWMTYVRQLEKALNEQAMQERQQAQPDPVQMAKIATEQAKLRAVVEKSKVEQMLNVQIVQSRIELDRRNADLQNALKIQKQTAEMLADALPAAAASNILTNANMHPPG